MEGIEKIIYELNNQIDDYNSGELKIRNGFELIDNFSYETMGYYSCIKFGDVILWDSENEPREYNEDNNEYEDLLTFIKKEFNKYLDTINHFRFTDVKIDNDLVMAAYDIADEIVENVDDEVNDDKYEKIVNIILKY